MSSNEIAVSARHLRGQICTLTEIRGVKVLETDKGVDLTTIGNGVQEQLNKFNDLLLAIEKRLVALETHSHGSSAHSSSTVSHGSLDAIMERLDILETEVKAQPKLIQGPRGLPGKTPDSLADIKDVDLNGLEDGCTLIYQNGKFRVQKLEYE